MTRARLRQSQRGSANGHEPVGAGRGLGHKASWYGCSRNSLRGIVRESVGFDDGKSIQAMTGFLGTHGPGH
ncbi:MAG: hypothetical protein OXK72_03315 [Gammaproteobacteria bacterium]|nr:hypothetical protein [Gammaproteobacteria bacterium]MDE0410809.1 hypothetical protein [Gammaproteobacteria bacterium]